MEPARVAFRISFTVDVDEHTKLAFTGESSACSRGKNVGRSTQA